LQAGKDITENEIKFKRIRQTFNIFTVVCVIICNFFYAISNFYDFQNQEVNSTGYTAAFISTYQLLASINLTIYITMMASLVALAKIIRGNQNVLLLNPIVFGLHILSFTLFILAFFVFDIFYSRSLVDWTTKTAKESSFTNAFSTACGFISQAIFMHILNAYS